MGWSEFATYCAMGVIGTAVVCVCTSLIAGTCMAIERAVEKRRDR